MIRSSVREILSDHNKAVAAMASENPLGDGKAGARIAKSCIDYCEGALPVNDGFTDRELLWPNSIIVKARYRGMTVAEFRERIGHVSVTMVYGRTGQPIFPRDDLCLEEGWSVLLFGNRSQLGSARLITKDVKTPRTKR